MLVILRRELRRRRYNTSRKICDVDEQHCFAGRLPLHDLLAWEVVDKQEKLNRLIEAIRYVFTNLKINPSLKVLYLI